MKKLLRTNSMFVIGAISWLLLILFLSPSCSSNLPPDCPCSETVCDLCADKIDQVNAAVEAQYFNDASGYQELVDQYHQLSSESGSAKEVRQEVDLYFDMSDSMSDKVKSAGQNDGLLSYLLNLIPRNSRFFQLTATGFQPVSAADPKIFVKIPANYTAQGNYAQLDSAMAAIVKNLDRQSILITDGELAVKGLTKNYRDVAWAKGHFNQWLRSGNQIDFIVHVVGNERLFFILFTPEKLAGKDEAGSVINKFVTSTGNAQKADQYNWLSFNINDYHFEKVADDRPMKQRGTNSTLTEYMGEEMYSRFEHVDDAYEHIHFEDKGYFTDYVDEFAAGKQAEYFRPEYKERNKLFYGLKLTNEFINYQIANLDIRVEDLSQSFLNYVDYLKCRQSTTVEDQDEEGNVLTYWCNPWNDCKDNTTCAYDLSEGVRPVREIFELHEESTIQQDASGFNTADIAIKPSKNFQAYDWSEMGYFKAGIYIRDVNYSNRQDFNLLKWDQDGELNTGLSESIRLAMQDLEPKDKLIYTYYFTYPIDAIIGLN